jgi:hypothetical protein
MIKLKQLILDLLKKSKLKFPDVNDKDLLPFFDISLKTDNELDELSKRGIIGPYSDPINLIESITSNKRLICYVEKGDFYENEILVIAAKNNLIYKKVGGDVYLFKQENEMEALKRISLLKLVRNEEYLFPAWEYLHGRLLDYRPEDIALYIKNHPNCNDFSKKCLDGARSVYKSISSAL